jgi:hypothetical protein
MGFRFDADSPEQVDNEHVNGDERNWPYYPHLLAGMGDTIDSYDQANGARASVLNYLGGKSNLRDDSATRLNGLGVVLGNINAFINKLNVLRTYI